MSTSLPPFSCQYSPNFPQILQEIGCSVALSTYQAGKVVFISPKNEQKLIQLPRSFPKAMGMSLKGNKLAVALKDSVQVFRNSKGLAQSYPRKAKTYDALFMPRATYYTGQVDLHDLHWGAEKIWAVNTSFSSLCIIDDDYSFRPVWKPAFISKLASEDRCHLNGLAMQDEKPAYVSALGDGDIPQSWRHRITEGGIIIEVETQEIVAEGLAMPHSPRLYDDQLLVLCSAAGELRLVEPQKGQSTVLFQADHFMRGMAKQGDYLFIGTSRLRKSSKTFSQLPMAKKAQRAGILVLHLPSCKMVAQFWYQNSVDEIYDVQLLPGMQRPNIVSTDMEEHRLGLQLPKATFWGRPRE